MNPPTWTPIAAAMITVGGVTLNTLLAHWLAQKRANPKTPTESRLKTFFKRRIVRLWIGAISQLAFVGFIAVGMVISLQDHHPADVSLVVIYSFNMVVGAWYLRRLGKVFDEILDETYRSGKTSLESRVDSLIEINGLHTDTLQSQSESIRMQAERQDSQEALTKEISSTLIKTIERVTDSPPSDDKF